MDSHVIAADLSCDQECSGNGHNPKKSCSDQKQQQAPRQLIIPPSVSVLCSACAQPQWESEWNFSIEDGVPFNNHRNNTSFKRGDLMKDIEKAGKSQKMRRKMGRVFYHRPPRVLLSP